MCYLHPLIVYLVGRVTNIWECTWYISVVGHPGHSTSRKIEASRTKRYNFNKWQRAIAHCGTFDVKVAVVSSIDTVFKLSGIYSRETG